MSEKTLGEIARQAWLTAPGTVTFEALANAVAAEVRKESAAEIEKLKAIVDELCTKRQESESRIAGLEYDLRVWSTECDALEQKLAAAQPQARFKAGDVAFMHWDGKTKIQKTRVDEVYTTISAGNLNHRENDLLTESEAVEWIKAKGKA